jgi:hypothetical protein
MPSLYKINNALVNPSQAADAFNNYFLSVIDRLNLTDVQADSAISHVVGRKFQTFVTHVPILVPGFNTKYPVGTGQS